MENLVERFIRGPQIWQLRSCTIGELAPPLSATARAKIANVGKGQFIQLDRANECEPKGEHYILDVGAGGDELVPDPDDPLMLIWPEKRRVREYLLTISFRGSEEWLRVRPKGTLPKPLQAESSDNELRVRMTVQDKHIERLGERVLAERRVVEQWIKAVEVDARAYEATSATEWESRLAATAEDEWRERRGRESVERLK